MTVTKDHQLLLVRIYESQLLVSPNFPDNYPANLRCRWILTAGTQSRWDKIHIHFVDLSMEDSQGCSNDYIRLEDENNRVITKIQ